MSTRTHVLGFPSMGADGELGTALESHRRDEIDLKALERTGAELRARHWQAQRQHVTCRPPCRAGTPEAGHRQAQG
ncbi:hypothetical protein [Variovorax sp. GT1P44]|uniref:hypothetical protein n=1 Tax=Variovorax sp. GT1P44 TaxID=3443742 RepID=UPI003F457300